MIGDHPTTSGSSDSAAEDRPPAQPLSLFTVLQQEFEELHGAAGASAAPDPGAPADGSSGDLEGLYRRTHGFAGPPPPISPSGSANPRPPIDLVVPQTRTRHPLL